MKTGAIATCVRELAAHLDYTEPVEGGVEVDGDGREDTSSSVGHSDSPVVGADP